MFELISPKYRLLNHKVKVDFSIIRTRQFPKELKIQNRFQIFGAKLKRETQILPRRNAVCATISISEKSTNGRGKYRSFSLSKNH